jgi:hypothetical protein
MTQFPLQAQPALFHYAVASGAIRRRSQLIFYLLTHIIGRHLLPGPATTASWFPGGRLARPTSELGSVEGQLVQMVIRKVAVTVPPERR